MPPVAQFRWTARGHPACQLGKPFSRSGASLPPHTLRAEWQRWILLEDSSGLQLALCLAALLQDNAVQIKAFPKPKSFLEAIRETMRAGQQSGTSLAASGGVPQDALQLAVQHGLLRLEPGQMLACQVPTQVAQGSGIKMMAQMPHLSYIVISGNVSDSVQPPASAFTADAQTFSTVNWLLYSMSPNVWSLRQGCIAQARLLHRKHACIEEAASKACITFLLG